MDHEKSAACVHCGKPTQLYVNNEPICPECDAKEPPAEPEWVPKTADLYDRDR
jgi:hypothetical protein